MEIKVKPVFDVYMTSNFIRDFVEHELSLPNISKKTRDRDYVDARFIGFALCRKYTKDSFAKIGQSFGDRDHGTVLHGVKVVYNWETDPSMHKEMEQYRQIDEALKTIRRLYRIKNPKHHIILKTMEDLDQELYEKTANQNKEYISVIEIKNHKIETLQRKITELKTHQKLILKRLEERPILDDVLDLDDDRFELLRIRIKAFLTMNKIKK